MIKSYFIILSIFLFFSCSTSFNKFSYRDISEFKFDTTVLKNNDAVLVLNVSGGPDLNEEIDYYYHWIIQNKISGDTINLLIPFIVPIGENNNSYNYFNQESNEYKFLIIPSDAKDIRDYKPKEIKRVITNKDFKDIEHNNYPTVIGVLGEIKQTDTSNSEF